MASKRFHELDLLRFLAAFSVLLYHYTFRGHVADNLNVLPHPWFAPATKYGFLGVHLFFLISGFVILMTASGGSKRHFVASRIVRLYPAFWICCTATFVVSLLAPHARHVSPRDYLVNMTMLGGFLGVPAVDSVYWSLFIELRFYLLVFLVLLFRQLHRARGLLGAWLVLYLVGTIKPIKVVSYLLIPDFAPYFIAGSMFFLISRDGLSLVDGLVVAACFGAIVRDVLGALPVIEAHLHTSFSRGIVGAILALFFLVFLAVSTGRTERYARRGWLALGALTYPLYLLHQNIGYAIFNAAYPAVNAYVLLAGVAALMLLLAYLVNRVERATARPLRAWLLRVIPEGKVRRPAPSAPDA